MPKILPEKSITSELVAKTLDINTDTVMFWKRKDGSEIIAWAETSNLFHQLITELAYQNIAFDLGFNQYTKNYYASVNNKTLYRAKTHTLALCKAIYYTLGK